MDAYLFYDLFHEPRRVFNVFFLYQLASAKVAAKFEQTEQGLVFFCISPRVCPVSVRVYLGLV